MTEKHISEVKLIKDTTHFAVTGELLGLVTYPIHWFCIITHCVISTMNLADTGTTHISVSAGIFAHCHIVYAVIVNGEILGDSDIYYCWLYAGLEQTKIDIYSVI